MQQRRPVSITIIGRFYKIIGISYFLGGLGSTCAVSNPAMVKLMSETQPGAGSSWRIGLVLLSVAGGFIWYSAIGFLDLRAWARASIETISWLVLATFVGGGVYLSRLLIRMPEVFFAGLGAPVGPVLSAICGAAIVVWIVMICFLRGRTIREAVRGSE
ncbi:MAG: hypothetical protein JRG94_00560 [Deltaproteobacteria bacterium]|nr:hypothetical protein [Deltaproteobacteria bacterium]